MGASAGDRDEACPSGVYLINEAQRVRILAGEAFPSSLRVARLDGEAARDRETFFTEIARILVFPDYFGRNWDAVYDCLTDPSVIPNGGVVLLLDGFGSFAVAEPEQWQIALKVLRDACAFWKPLSASLHVLLYGPAEDAHGIGTFPIGRFS